MESPEHPLAAQRLQNLPKVELHRHLEGSLRISTLRQIARQHNLPFPADTDLPALVQIQAGEPLTFANFLSKVQPLRQFYQSPQIITRVVEEVIADAAAEQVRHLELRFTPAALARAQGFPLNEVMDWVIESACRAASQRGLSLALIASFNRHEPLELARQVTALSADRAGSGIDGLDLAGNEAEFSALPFAGLLREAKQSGLHLTIHAGEWGGAANVREAIQDLHTDRIGHGVRVLEDPSIAALARERQIPFEVCVTSNVQSGVCPSVLAHPVRGMLAAGLNATLNTDDPSISNIDLTHEYRLAVQELQLTLAQLKDRILAAARASFLPPAEKQTLCNSLELELAQQITT
ncbi:MAG: adenosine deaminase [Chloroflexi bacterium]|nr:adenosine deaminase [Chloroflexota bacterium]